MNPDDRAKYLNGPESPLFHKGATLYGLPEARRILGAERSRPRAVVVVEGYMDVIACQRAGMPAVAPMGTALTEEQMELLWRVSSGADPVLRRRRGGPARRLSRHRPRPAAAEARPVVPVRPAGGRQGPRRHPARQGRAGAAPGHGRDPPFAEVLFQREGEVEPLDTPERRAGPEGAAAHGGRGDPGQGSGRTVPARAVRPLRRPVPARRAPQAPQRGAAGGRSLAARAAAQAGPDGRGGRRPCRR